VAFFVLALAYSAAVHFTNRVLPEDDAFITYRYVDNLVSGKGLVYNPGQRVFGASTPLYVAWLAAVKALVRSVPTPDLAVRLNVIFHWATAVGILLLLMRFVRQRWLAFVLAGFFAIREWPLVVSTSGMESLLFAAAVLWTLWALATRRLILAGVLAGLSVLVRPEGVLLAGVVLVFWLLYSRQGYPQFLAALLVPGVIWTVFGLAYYGTPLYHSILAKSHRLYPVPFGYAIADIGRALRQWTTGGALRANVVLALVMSALAGLGFVLRRRLLKPRAVGALPVIAFTLALVMFYFITNPMMFAWYYPVMEALWFLIFSTGLVWLGSRLRGRVRHFGLPAVGLVILLLGYYSLKAPVGRVMSGVPLAHLPATENYERQRIVGYEHAAEWLNQTVPDDVTLVSPEIGALGYYYKGSVIDACGLVSPEALPFLPVPADERYAATSGALSRELVKAVVPDIVVTLRCFAALSLYRDDWFRSDYVLVQQFPLPHEVWGSGTVDVFFRRDRVSSE
jgi:hypothetical protein